MRRGTKREMARGVIPVKIHPIVLYVDTSLASQEAITLLAQLGVPMDVQFCSTREEEVLPAAVYRGYVHKGTDGVKTVFEQIRFDARAQPGVVAVADPTIPGFVIRYDLMRTNKPLDEITPYDFPRGFDAEDVCAIEPDGTLMLTRPKPRQRASP